MGTLLGLVVRGGHQILGPNVRGTIYGGDIWSFDNGKAISHVKISNISFLKKVPKCQGFFKISKQEVLISLLAFEKL